jgi:HTH-type transcriptional regulator/antitoxin HigA
MKVMVNNRNTFKPNWVSPPGQTIVDIMRWKGISSEELSKALSMNTKAFQTLLEGNSRITGAIADKISKLLGGPVDFWLTRDEQYNHDLQFQNASYKEWINSVPLTEMIQLGWISDSNETRRIDTCLNFFGYSDPKKMVKAHNYISSQAHYRTSKSFVTFSAPLAAWLRQGAIEASKIQCKNWDPDKFRNLMSEIRNLTCNKNPQFFIPKLKKICADCGVALAVVKSPSGCKASGATFKINNSTPTILLSARHLSNDHLWFTFFHEAGHVLLHLVNMIIVDEDRDGSLDKIEKEADAFAEEIIVPKMYREEFESLRNSYNEVLQFASKIGIAAGLIVGQLQHNGKIQQNQLNKVKRRYTWHENQLISQ